MDKELDKTELGITPAKSFIRVTESNLPGSKAHRGSVVSRRTIGVEALANRIASKGSSFRKETLLTSYRLMTNEIYDAIEDGYNVDFGLGRTEITVAGNFTTPLDKFDKNHHCLTPRLLPSPRLKQCVSRIPAENITGGLFKNTPRPNNIGTSIEPYNRDTDGLINVLPAGRHLHVSIFGQRLKVGGELPGVGVAFRCLETGEEYLVSSLDLVINSGPRLAITPQFEFTPGDWEVEIGSQLNPSYRPYKEVRYAILPFSVE